MGRSARPERPPKRCWLGLVLVPLLSGCAFGPRVLESSHGRYQESIKQVQDEEFLRNLVHMRYTESYNHLDVASITAQYELTTGAEARPFFLAPNPSGSGVFKTFTSVLPDVTISGANRPTISLIPGDDAETVQRLLRPVTPEAVLFFAESGWPIGTIFRLWLDSANAVPNAEPSHGAGPLRACEPDYLRFRRAADLIQSLMQRRTATFTVEVRTKPQGVPLPMDRLTAEAQIEASKNGLECVPGADPGTYILVRRDRKMVLKIDPLALSTPEYQELCDLLWLQPGLTQYDVTQGALPPYPASVPADRLTTLDILPRSTVQALIYMSHGVSVPPEHIGEGLASSTIGRDGLVFDWRQVTDGIFAVCSAKQHRRPEHAYVAVKYRDYWFYVDDRDHESKATFNLMLQLTRIDLGGADTRAGKARPILTLPVGR
jgi:hypothetical protein